jgi:hypothetical protein
VRHLDDLNVSLMSGKGVFDVQARELTRSPRRRPPARSGGLALLLVALGALALVVSGCGGSKSPSVASLAATTPAGTVTSSNSGSSVAALSGSPAGLSGSHGEVSFEMVGVSGADEMKFAACMRSNGVPSFPDPNAQGAISLSGLDPNSPALQKAMQTCQKEMPNGGALTPAQQAQQSQQLLEFSACMRSHGLPSFPEPKRDTLTLGAGIDSNSPQFQAAQKACASLAPGGGSP